MPIERFEAKTERELRGKMLRFCTENEGVMVSREIIETDYGRDRNGISKNLRFESTIHYEGSISS